MRVPLPFVTLLSLLSVSVADPVISEFLASNQNGIRDDDGNRSDWIEIYNPEEEPVDLTGWYLTDNAGNRTKWQFPETTLAPGEYLLVYASDKDRRIAGQPLHTNFALSAGGEYLGLIRPDGVTAVSEYHQQFPTQYPDVSYGIPSNIDRITLVGPDAPCRWVVPSSDPDPSWRESGFNDGSWNAALQGIGYDRNTSGVNFLPLIGAGGNTEGDMFNKRTSCYLRVPFSLPAGTDVLGLTLKVNYDDGFAAWINGQPLLSGSNQLRRNVPDDLRWNSEAARTNEDIDAVNAESFDVRGSLGQLVAGYNVLAFHVLNYRASSSDLLFRVQLEADVTTAGPPAPPGYFATPTPGGRNSGPAGLVLPQTVSFSAPSRTFTTNFSLALNGAIDGQRIRYTTDGSVPGSGSPIYSGPVSVTGSVLVRARVEEIATGTLGFASSAKYEKLASTVSNYSGTGQVFRSSLPVVVLNNRGKGQPSNDNQIQDARLMIFDRDGSGYSNLAASPALSMNVAMKLRGRSSSGFPKKSYGFELRDENGQETSAPVLGMPSGEDWALVSCWDFDRAFMRNAWVYEMYRRAGRWAPRTRLVEVFANLDGDNLEYADYQGVYILCENVRRGPDRVDVARLDISDTTLPNLSGGYIFKIDAGESDEYVWRTTRNLPTPGTGGDGLVIHRPKLPNLAPQQSAYLVDYFQQFEDTLFSESAAGFTTRNYRNFIDTPSWVDHNLFNAFAKNVDALRLSAYFHKNRGGKIEGGALWDFDRSADSTDGRDNDTNSWRGGGDSTDYFNFSWWGPLFQDAEFRQAYVDRWQELRRDVLSTPNLHAVLDGFLAEFKADDADHPARRDYARWYGSPNSNNIASETQHLKQWLQNRAVWIDGRFTPQPAISRASGEVAAGETVTITVPGGTVVYYTTDGSDPRAEGGGISASAIAYGGNPLGIDSSMRLIARAWRASANTVPSTNWSGPVVADYLVDESYATADELRISALNYHPLEPDADELAVMPELDGSQFEWIELKNVSSGTVNLEGVSFVAGMPVSGVVLPSHTLPPGGRALVVKNTAAFTLRYGSAAASRIVVEWSGDNSLSNSGETIRVLDRNGGVIAHFDYDDEGSWPVRPDGGGSVLEHLGGDYADPANWRASAAIHGTPGEEPRVASPVVVNEIVASGDMGLPGAIELHNPSEWPVDLGGWFLSASSSPVTADDLRHYRIPEGTTVPAGGYVVIDEAQFNPNGGWNPSPGDPGDNEFPIDAARGGFVRLVSAEPEGTLLSFETEAEWTPLLAGTSFGRFPDGTGDFLPLAESTLSATNAGPRIGAVQVSEIHYHPESGTPEFIEITNTTGWEEALGRWALEGGVSFHFPPDFALGAGESVVMVPFDPVSQTSMTEEFRLIYGVDPAIRLVGPWSGSSLANAGDTVRLQRRVPAPEDDPEFVGRMLEDEVSYLAQSPWPTGASGTGSSIRRMGVFRYGSDPTAWVASVPTPGRGAPGFEAWRREFLAGTSNATAAGDADGDGIPNLVEYLMGTDPNDPSPLMGSVDEDNARFVLEYTRRLDRDDGNLFAVQSGDLTEWIPAVNDEPVTDDGTTEWRRAWIPFELGGFLRLEAE